MSRLFIKNVVCLVPGYNDTTNGSLLGTDEILGNIRSVESDETFDVDFIKKKIGIESVSVSNSSLSYLRENWGSETVESEAFSKSQSSPNDALLRMLEDAIQRVVPKDGSKVVAHVHLSAFLSPWMESDFLRIRKRFGIGLENPVATLIVQQGCAGLIGALELARTLSALDGDGDILITAENNMMAHAHQRLKRTARKDNVNEWLWPVIFGEAVGAMIVGVEDEFHKGFYVAETSQRIVERDWRVRHRWSKSYSDVYIKAKEVSQTYLKYVKEFALKGVEKSGGKDNVSYLCMHESNPRLLDILRRDLGFDEARVPTISAKVGTLACVSAFSLLDRVLNSENPNKKVVLALIGETCGDIVAGNIVVAKRA